MKNINKGDEVSWKWGAGLARGVVQSIHPEKTVRKLKGSLITRNSTKDDPALMIKQKDGLRVLRLAHEVRRGQ